MFSVNVYEDIFKTSTHLNYSALFNDENSRNEDVPGILFCLDLPFGQEFSFTVRESAESDCSFSNHANA